jgi:alcohol dehydrogenase class IV
MPSHHFSFECPRGIYFGPGARKNLPWLLESIGKKVLVLTGQKWLVQSGWKKKLEKLLQSFQCEFFPCRPGEPTIESIDTLRKETAGFQPDVLLAVGGGSVIDTAKALSALIPLNESPSEYLEGVGAGKLLSSPGLPWIAVPTTSGTGAEVTKNSVIRATAKGAKKSFRSPFLIAAYAVVDPELTLELPLSMTGVSGMDAFTQLLESYVSAKSQPMTKALVQDALPKMYRALKSLPSDLHDLNARTDAAYGSMVSGIALANAGLGAAHGFASGLGGLYEIPHGMICAVFLGPVLKKNAPSIEDEIGELLVNGRLYEGSDPVGWLVSEVDKLLELFQLDKNLRAYAIDKSDVEMIAERSAGSSMSGNPVPLNQKDKVALLEQVL